jgi:pyruvate/2-oxoglutarate dehydrogenase complex dihydrolipoamide acyltransferase (E2) component
MARERGLDLRGVMGTGPGGRIVREDVLRHAEKPVSKEGPETELLCGRTIRAEQPVSGMRRQIFQHMHRSLQETAQMTLTAEVDATELHRFRQALLKQTGQEGSGISYNALLVRIVARALQEHPSVNASVEGERILQWADVHVGVAMELDEGLIVPVVRHADRLPVPAIEKTLQDLFQRARQRKLLPDEIQGGTFTITNLGQLGIDGFTPILNRPESGILGVGRILEKPVAVRTSGESRMEIRRRVVLSLTVDHRIVDGAPAARFLRRVGDLIEEPFLLIS